MQKHLEVFNQLATDLGIVSKNYYGPVTLVLTEGKIEVQATPFDKRNQCHIGTISRFEMGHGLTDKRWGQIKKLCYKHFHRKEIT